MGTTIENRPGPSSGFQDEYIAQAKKLCKLGAIDEEIADFFDVSVRTIYRWKHQFPKFSKALEAGKRHPDQRVVQALYKRAVGFTMTETKVMQFQGSPVYAQVDVYHPPDVRAAMSWLVNRLGWRMNPTGEMGVDEPTPESIPVEIVDARLPPPGDA